MKTTFLFLLTGAFISNCFAQDFPGYRSGNYNGVNSVFFNPANIADSRYRFDVNLVSISTQVSNNQASFRLKDIGKAFNSDDLSEQVFGNNAGLAKGFVSADVHGPSVMFNTGKKMSVAVTTRARAMVNITDIDGKLAHKISDDFSNDATLPYSVSSPGNSRININGWTEYGLSVARVINDQGRHFFKAGITLNYLAGAGNGYMSIANLNGTLNQDNTLNDNYLTNTTGRIALGFGGVNLSDFEAEQLTKMKSSGVGASVGVVYEFRPGAEGTAEVKRDMNKYKLKIGLAVLDVGRIRYDKDMQRSGAYNINITGNNRFYLDRLSGLDIDDYKTFFNNNPQYFTADNSNAESSYKVSLPSSLHLNADYHVNKGFYVNLSTQLSLLNTDIKPYNSTYYSSFILTPRIEGKSLGLYVPVSYSKLTDLNAGVSFRVGPLFFGSGSILTALIGHSKQADVHVGLRFGGMQ